MRRPVVEDQLHPHAEIVRMSGYGIHCSDECLDEKEGVGHLQFLVLHKAVVVPVLNLRISKR